MSHIPVLFEETLLMLQPERGGVFLDATLGLGGHTGGMLERAGKAKIRILGMDQDPNAMAQAMQRLGDKIEYISGNFGDLAEILDDMEVGELDGVLMDIGVSSYQIDTPSRGFSFLTDGPLDMRMDPEADLTASYIVNRWSERDLTDIFFKYGEERLSRKIARLVCERREKQQFLRTMDLAEVITSAYPPHARYKHSHPATRVFQALRIVVNDELGVLEQGIKAAMDRLAPGGILAVITFHSLEDRIVKHTFRERAAGGDFEVLTKKPIVAGDDERRDNSRSRSAKLRGIRRITN